MGHAVETVSNQFSMEGCMRIKKTLPPMRGLLVFALAMFFWLGVDVVFDLRSLLVSFF